MATALGKFLRKLRIENDELMKTMANKLALAPSTLSSIENGRRNPPKGFVEKISVLYKLSEGQIAELLDALYQSQDEVKMRIGGLSDQDKELAVAFARKFANLNEDNKKHIRKILNDENT